MKHIPLGLSKSEEQVGNESERQRSPTELYQKLRVKEKVGSQTARQIEDPASTFQRLRCPKARKQNGICIFNDTGRVSEGISQMEETERREVKSAYNVHLQIQK